MCKYRVTLPFVFPSKASISEFCQDVRGCANAVFSYIHKQAQTIFSILKIKREGMIFPQPSTPKLWAVHVTTPVIYLLHVH